MWLIPLALIGIITGWALTLSPGRERQYGKTVFVLSLAGLLLGVVIGAVRVVPAGYVGVIDVFGHVSPTSLSSGIHFVNPLANVVLMPIRTQEDKETMSVPSKEGLTIELEISALFHLDPAQAVTTYKTVGRNYVDVIFIPQMRAAARGVTGGSEAKALYTSEREGLGQSIQQHLEALVNPRGIIVENVLLRKVTLPRTVSDAIEQKLKAEQESERMKFINQREELEADRKRIEAKGTRDSQAIISETLTPQYLHYLWIKTLSDNENVIYVATEANMPLTRTLNK